MPEKRITERANEAAREGKAPTTQAGELIRDEMEKLKEGEGAQSKEQAVAIGLSKARRAGVEVPVPPKGKVSERTRRKAVQDLRKGKEASATKRPAAQKGRSAAARRAKADRSAAAKKGAETRKKRQEAQAA